MIGAVGARPLLLSDTGASGDEDVAWLQRRQTNRRVGGGVGTEATVEHHEATDTIGGSAATRIGITELEGRERRAQLERKVERLNAAPRSQ
jgi:hypothetical protein